MCQTFISGGKDCVLYLSSEKFNENKENLHRFKFLQVKSRFLHAESSINFPGCFPTNLYIMFTEPAMSQLVQIMFTEPAMSQLVQVMFTEPAKSQLMQIILVFHFPPWCRK